MSVSVDEGGWVLRAMHLGTGAHTLDVYVLVKVLAAHGRVIDPGVGATGAATGVRHRSV